MKASELRIGNLVQYGGVVNKVYLISHNYFQVESTDIPTFTANKNRAAEPIPLTEEWLLRLGFTKPNDWHCYKLVIGDDELQNLESSLQVSFEGCGFVQICWGGINAYSAQVKYVHQLQNLYFALTGEELTLNP